VANGTKVPQCSWIFGPAVSGKGLEKLRRTARAVFGFTEVFPGVHVVHPAPEEAATPLSMEGREKVKQQLAEGKEYFYTDINGVKPAEVINLLKAFSLFKKRQLSNMKLVLAGAGTIDKLDSYKYREDICLFPKGTEGLMEAAYAVIQTPYRSDPGIALLSAWRARTPVIMVANGTKWDPETVLRVPADNVGDLAEALKSLYKNEGIRNELIEKGASRVAGLSIRESAAAIGAFLGI